MDNGPAKPTAREKTASSLALLAAGQSEEQIAKDLKIGIASVYRIRAHKDDQTA